MVIPNRIFDLFWNQKEKELYKEDSSLELDPRKKQRNEFIKGLNKVFFRSLFDGFNECLDYERNFGQFGKPFPWKSSTCFNHVKSLEEIKVLLDLFSNLCRILKRK